jgi:hypothetical protein
MDSPPGDATTLDPPQKDGHALDPPPVSTPALDLPPASATNERHKPPHAWISSASASSCRISQSRRIWISLRLRACWKRCLLLAVPPPLEDRVSPL